MERKGKLKNRKEWIDEDLTWKERKVKWLIKRKAEKVRVEEKRVRVGHMKIWIEGREWRWDEREGKLKDGAGNELKGEEGKEGR